MTHPFPLKSLGTCVGVGKLQFKINIAPWASASHTYPNCVPVIVQSVV